MIPEQIIRNATKEGALTQEENLAFSKFCAEQVGGDYQDIGICNPFIASAKAAWAISKNADKKAREEQAQWLKTHTKALGNDT